jgi:hypothetical protein
MTVLKPSFFSASSVETSVAPPQATVASTRVKLVTPG